MYYGCPNSEAVIYCGECSARLWPLMGAVETRSSPCRQPEMPDQNPEPENGRGEQTGRLQQSAEDPGD